MKSVGGKEAETEVCGCMGSFELARKIERKKIVGTR
jgi:hypothetical protein